MKINRIETFFLVLVLALVSSWMLLSCNSLPESGLDPDLVNTYGDSTLSQDKDGNGISDYLDENAPGCELSANECLGIANANKIRKVSSTPRITGYSLPQSNAPGGILVKTLETHLLDTITLRVVDTSLLPIAMRIWDRDSDGVHLDTTKGPEWKFRYASKGVHKVTVRSLAKWGDGYRVSKPVNALPITVITTPPKLSLHWAAKSTLNDSLPPTALTPSDSFRVWCDISDDRPIDSLEYGFQERRIRAKTTDTLVLATGLRGDTTFAVTATITDAEGENGSDSFAIPVIWGRPSVAFAGPRYVSILDSVDMAAAAHDTLGGKVVEIAWRTEAGGAFISCGKETCRLRAPGTPGSWKVVVRATDDDGLQAFDSALVQVVLGLPSARAIGPVRVTPNDSVALSAVAVDTMGGRIVEIAWRVIAGGPFLATPDGKMTALSPAVIGTWRPVLRVTDDDGNVVYDSLSIDVVLGRPGVKATFSPTSVGIGDSVRFVVAGVDSLGGRIVARAWQPDPGAAFISLDSSVFWALAPRTVGLWRPVFKVTDDDGLDATDTLNLTVRQSEPTAHAGPDTTVLYGDTLRITGTGTDVDGRIVGWAWRVDSSQGFVKADSGRLVLAAPAQDTAIVAILRVQDDDGLFGYDTLRIKVSDGTPIVTAGADFSANINDTVNLTGRVQFSAADIAEYAWSVDGGVTFTKTANGLFSFQAPKRAGTIEAVYRAIDVKGRTGKDTVKIFITENPPTANAKSTATSGLAGGLFRLKASGSDQGRIVEYAWNIGPGGTFFKTSTDTQITAPNISPWVLVLRVMDDDSLFAYDTVKVAVTPPTGPSVAFSGCTGKCSGLTILDSISLRATITPSGTGFTIARRAWVCGGDTVFTSVDSARVKLGGVFTPTVTCRVIATQSNGGKTEATATLSLVLDLPKVTLTGPSEVALGETVTLTGKAKDGYGHIIQSGWDLDGDGILDTLKKTSDTLFSLNFKPTSLKPLTLFFRAMDDDSLVSEDTLNLTVFTPIGGIFSQDSVLAKSGNPYRLNRNMKIETGVTLTLEPGVILEIPDTLRLKVRGAINAIGTASDSIYFRTTGRSRPSQMILIDTATLVNYVGGIPVGGNQFKYCSFIKCSVQPTKSNFHLEKSSLSDTYWQVINNSTNGWVREPVLLKDVIIQAGYLYVYDDSGSVEMSHVINPATLATGYSLTGKRILIEDCFLDNSALGLTSDSLSLRTSTFLGGAVITRRSASIFLDIRSNRFAGAGTAPTFRMPDSYRGEIADNAFEKTSLEFTYNNLSIDTLQIRNNSFEGSANYIAPGASYTSFFIYCTHIHHNIFKSTSGVYFSEPLDSTSRVDSNSFEMPTAGGYFTKVKDSKARLTMGNFKYNYWGTVSLSEINARIYDYDFDFTLPQVDVSPLLTAPPSQVGPRTPVGSP